VSPVIQDKAKAIIARMFGKGGGSRSNEPRPKPLPRSTVEHDSVDSMMFGNYADDSPRFSRIAVEEKPRIPHDIVDPPAPDFTSASPDEIRAWQETVKQNAVRRQNAPEYEAWEDLTRDAFYAFHHPTEPEVLAPEDVDPGVAHHAKIMQKIQATEEYADTRNMTRTDPVASAAATMAMVKELRTTLEEELVQQARDAEEFEQARDRAEAAMGELDSARNEIRDWMAANPGQPVPGSMVSNMSGLVDKKRAAQGAAAQHAMNIPAPFTKAAHDAVINAVKAAQTAAKNIGNVPTFGAGLGAGEPRYDSPEQALTIADMWANNPVLRKVATLYGRLDKHIRFERAKRTVGGQDEIVDLKLGDELRRLHPSELGNLADDDLEDDFYTRWLSSEVVVYETVGEEHAGRGPIVLVGDESGSMSGERNIWLKALACCLLNICRREKRDFAYVGFGSANEMTSHLFPAKQALRAQDVLDMASHFFNGGTAPLVGTTEAKRIMEDAVEFKKADIVIVGDGQASFGHEDKVVRDTLRSRGVRIHAIGIAGTHGYLKEYVDEGSEPINVHDFDLTDPSEATAHLATHIT
jgi:uncharacterized protein with von Willebrand factor type A (vWA) domain